MMNFVYLGDITKMTPDLLLHLTASGGRYGDAKSTQNVPL